MTHEPEVTFDDAVVEWFTEKYGEENVEQNVYQPDPYWFADLVVDTGYATLFIEIENDADSVRDGVGQALGYAGEDLESGIPMVVVPRGHLDDAGVDRLRRGSRIIIREFDAEPPGEWV